MVGGYDTGVSFIGYWGSWQTPPMRRISVIVFAKRERERESGSTAP